jgi:Domain of unknown function (DUF4252)
MKSFIKYSMKLALLTALPLIATSAMAQDAARLHFDKLNALDARAKDVVEVTIDGKLLDLAKRATVKVNDPDAKRIGQAISGLKGIYVRVYNFEHENEYNVADVEQIRSELNAPGWERLANVRSKQNNQKVDVYTMFTGDQMSGAAVVISDAKSVALVNVVGVIDIETLVELSGKFNIPKIDIERDKTAGKPKNDKE